MDCKNTQLFYVKIDNGVFDVKISLVKTELTTYCKLFPTTIASVLKLHQHISKNIISIHIRKKGRYIKKVYKGGSHENTVQ